jgi:hypothetical protein
MNKKLAELFISGAAGAVAVPFSFDEILRPPKVPGHQL